MIAYIIQMIVCSAVLYIYYFLFLRNKRLHAFNRIYLLTAVVLSFLLPFTKFDFVNNTETNGNVAQLVNMLYFMPAEQDILFVSGNRNIFSVPLIIGCISVLITLILLMRLMQNTHKIYQLKRRYPVEKKGKIDIVYTDVAEAPFSFLNNLFWHQDLSMNTDTEKQILRHELTHIVRHHSWDRLFLQVVKAVCWFNPVYYLIEKEIILIHEYIADEEAIENKDGRAFAAMLLRSRIENFGYAPGQGIFYSSIKKRLHMLTNNKKTTYSIARRLMILPVVGCIAFVYSCQNTDNKEATGKESEQSISIQDSSANNHITPIPTMVQGASVEVADKVDREAIFPGNWETFLRSNVNSDVPVVNNAPPGTFRVTVRFDVDAEGNVSNVEAVNNPGYGTAAEAVKAIKASGKWEPAEKDGKKVASKKKQSIVFQVQE